MFARPEQWLACTYLGRLRGASLETIWHLIILIIDQTVAEIAVQIKAKHQG